MRRNRLVHKQLAMALSVVVELKSNEKPGISKMPGFFRACDVTEAA